MARKRSERALARLEQARLDRAFIRVYREEARTKQDNKCRYCRERLTAKTCTADHYQPRKAFGNDGRSNIVAACEPCNKAKGHMPPKIFEERIQRPQHGDPYPIWIAWSRRNINIRLEAMELRLLGPARTRKVRKA